MPHPLVDQLFFVRGEFKRCLEGVSAEDAVRRVGSMNCLSWFVGHMAMQESAFWVLLAQGIKLRPELRDLTGTGKPASTPSLEEMWTAWDEVTKTADQYLNRLTTETLQTHFIWKGQPFEETVGTLLLRNNYHYLFHTGEAHAVRQALGHTNLPEFIGKLDEKAPYRPE